MRDPQRSRRHFLGERDDIEAAWLAHRPEPRNAFATADEFLNRSMAVVSKDPAADARPLFVRRYRAKRNRWAGLHTGESGVPLAASARRSYAESFRGG